MFHVKHGRGAVTVLAVLGAVALLPGTVGTASADTIPAYRMADGATAVKGTPGADDAPQLHPGLHTDAIRRGEQKHYAVTLDDRHSAYFSVVAAPLPGTKVEDYKDELTISVQNHEGRTCSADASPTFNGGGMAYPIADYATRRIGADRTSCQQAGPYHVVVTRKGAVTSGPGTWPIELDYVNEPLLKGSAPARPGKGTWSTVAPPAPRTGTTRRTVAGGTGFNDAGSVGPGVWKDHIRPGETRFYRVPVDWGQRLNLSADVSHAPSTSSSRPSASSRPSSPTSPSSPRSAASSAFITDALGLSVYNPARGAVSTDRFVAYRGKQATARKFTAPVDYGNRFHPSHSVSAMRFAGWYYLEVSLHPDTARYFPDGTDLTLGVDVRGTAKPGPGYAEPAGIFSVTPEDRETARDGRTAQEAERSGTLTTVGYAGIGTGAALLVGLGAWTLLARRSASPGPPGRRGGQRDRGEPGQQGEQHQRFGPPQGW
ncbi:hypothetical protein [Streptomyces sp. NBRC 110611]|uniref:hypothetical protein n=1 Tax=Streptomyces sp. NBRC 110611 TaxID=1621259 RepID=UPI00082F81F5|nr:hypothetical protein [Streptomyces sp. NBRC 110611]